MLAAADEDEGRAPRARTALATPAERAAAARLVAAAEFHGPIVCRACAMEGRGTAMTATATPAVGAGARAFRIDEEFERLCPRLTSEERDLLASSIVAHGVREPLVVWRETKILLDGHTRLAVCDEHDVP